MATFAWLYRLDRSNRSNFNCNNRNLNNDNGSVFRIVLATRLSNKMYSSIISFDNLMLAWKKARKGKTKHKDIIKFEEDAEKNLIDLYYEFKEDTYQPMPLKTFILRDPKTRKISKADFRDRIVHHALINIIAPIFEKSFMSRHLTKTAPFKVRLCLEHPKIPNKPRLLSCGKKTRIF